MERTWIQRERPPSSACAQSPATQGATWLREYHRKLKPFTVQPHPLGSAERYPRVIARLVCRPAHLFGTHAPRNKLGSACPQRDRLSLSVTHDHCIVRARSPVDCITARTAAAAPFASAVTAVRTITAFVRVIVLIERIIGGLVVLSATASVGVSCIFGADTDQRR